MREVLDRLERAGIRCWLDGGWGVDALVARQTRPHVDLDLVLAADDIDPAVAALADLDLAVAESDLPTRLVLAGDRGRAVDIHPVRFTAEGDGLQTLQDGRVFAYPVAGFQAVGYVDGRPSRCLSVDVQVLCHLGYPPDDTDRHDMHLLREAFGVDLPAPYADDSDRPV
ncbi:MAG TPA: hypothetical protein VFN57_18485 [Thermomicrobiaceae bacterium]|nr:hypothetical protein [Thermomicrobiaceae bacterium]